MRIFYAVQFLDAVKQAMAENMSMIKRYATRGSYTRRDNFHVTLLFIGECEPRSLADYKQAADLTGMKFKPFKAEIDVLGSFKRPDGDILWAGMRSEPEDILSGINESLLAELRGLSINIKRDHNKFVPHVTIARRFSGDLTHVKFAPIDFTVDSIVIMESIFANGVVYKPLHESKLSR
jgi:2'-5' RNA ligase